MAFWNMAMFCLTASSIRSPRRARAPKALATWSRILLLLAREAVQRHLQIGGQDALHLAAVEADQLAQELDGQQGLAPAFFLEDDLGQDLTGQFLVGLGVEDDEVDALAHHLGQVFERDVGAGRACCRAAGWRTS